MDKQLLKIKNESIILKRIKEQKSNTLSHIRLFIFILTISTFIIALSSNNYRYLIITFLFLIFFIFLVAIHDKIIKEINKISKYIQIISRYENRLNEKWKDEEINQQGEFNHPTNDLDIIGNDSLLKYINFTNSLGGLKKLISSLNLNTYTKTSILNSQSSIKELKEKQKFILDFQYNLSKIENINNINYQEYLSYFQKVKEENKIITLISYILSILSIVILIISQMNPKMYSLLLIIIIIQMFLSYICSISHSKEFDSINKTVRQFGNLSKTFDVITNQQFNSSNNKNLQEKIIKGQKSIKLLVKISNLNSLRLNFITYIIFNTFISLNFIIIKRYNFLMNNNLDSLKESINALEEFERLISLTTICFVKKETSLPIISENNEIKAKSIKHPLINEKQCIPNDFYTIDEINIITGSNMSGKTSFMKTIGINLILAYNGTYVNATSFTIPIAKIFTSINVKDDISKGISTFYGELERIKEIIEYNNDNKKPIIVFIDEIFKGTNYNDRILGAKEVLKHLVSMNCIAFITTHDFELCSSENNKINNYHFTETYHKNKIHFDYKIKEGQCKTTNAKYLMKQMKIIK